MEYVYCYNDLTGKLLWTYGNGGAGNSTNAGLNYPYGDYPTFSTGYWQRNNILGYYCPYLDNADLQGCDWRQRINATTGQQIWQFSGITAEFSSMSYAMADGYNTWFNGYDNSIYVVGRGPSATTVQAPQTAITAGNNVIIQGTVMDISAGTTQTEQAADFPHGVPCASDTSMTAWMGYVYQQQPEPTNFTGVTVTLTAIDPNNNFITSRYSYNRCNWLISSTLGRLHKFQANTLLPQLSMAPTVTGDQVTKPACSCKAQQLHPHQQLHHQQA